MAKVKLHTDELYIDDTTNDLYRKTLAGAYMRVQTSGKNHIFASAKAGAAVTPNDSGDHPYNALFIGGAGDVKVDLVDGGTLTFINLPAGSLLPVHVTRVYSTGTSATNILGLTW